MAVGTLRSHPAPNDILTAQEIQRRLRPIFEKYQVRRAFLFGSYARGDARADSDIDLRIEKGDNEKLRGLLQESAMQLELMAAVGRDVDLLTAYPDSIYMKLFRRNMERDQVMIYDDSQPRSANLATYV